MQQSMLCPEEHQAALGRTSSRSGTELNPLLSFALTPSVPPCPRGHTAETRWQPQPKGHLCPSSPLRCGARAARVYGVLKWAASLLQICELDSSNIIALSKPLPFAKRGVGCG